MLRIWYVPYGVVRLFASACLPYHCDASESCKQASSKWLPKAAVSYSVGGMRHVELVQHQHNPNVHGCYIDCLCVSA